MIRQVQCQQTPSQIGQWIGLGVWGLDTARTTGVGVCYQRVEVWGLTLEEPSGLDKYMGCACTSVCATSDSKAQPYNWLDLGLGKCSSLTSRGPERKNLLGL